MIRSSASTDSSMFRRRLHEVSKKGAPQRSARASASAVGTALSVTRSDLRVRHSHSPLTSTRKPGARGHEPVWCAHLFPIKTMGCCSVSLIRSTKSRIMIASSKVLRLVTSKMMMKPWPVRMY